MKEEVNKRKIRIFLTLEGKYIQKKDEIKKLENDIIEVENYEVKKLTEKSKKDTFFENTEATKKEEIYKNTVGPFQLVVYKLPWYRKAFRSLAKFLGFKLEY